MVKAIPANPAPINNWGALFRLNEYNILGLVYASIVIMRCRK